jgi:hypothetical protein
MAIFLSGALVQWMGFLISSAQPMQNFLAHLLLLSSCTTSAPTPIFLIPRAGRVILWIDNQAAIKKVNQTQKASAKRRHTSHDADIIGQIADRLDRLKLKIRLQWVKSHQDRKTPYHDLDLVGRMNIDADSLAEHFWLFVAVRIILPLQQGLNNPLLAVTPLIDGIQIPSHYSHWICSIIQKQKHYQYLQEKHGWTDEVWSTVDFLAVKSAFLTLDPI